MGNNAVYHGYAGLPDDAGRVYTDEMCDIEADRAAAVGLKIARTYYKWYAYDFEKECWDWDNPTTAAFVRWAKRLKDRGIDIAINTGWNSPGDVLSSSWGGKSPFTVEGDWKASVEKYAEWVSETAHQLIEVRGLTNIKYFIMFTEPQNGAGRMENQNIYGAWYDEVKAVDERLKKDGRRHLVKLVGPNEGSTTNPLMMKWVKENAPGLLDVYTCHNYLNGLAVIKPKTGNCVTAGSTRGMRIQQKVDLKPNTEYEISAEFALDCADYLTVSGYVLMGAYKPEEQKGLFTAGGQPTTRLTQDSSYMIDAGALSKEFKEFSFKFKTGNDVKDAVIGIFGDIIQQGFTLEINSVHAKEVSTGKELLVNCDFDDVDDGWDSVACAIGSVGGYGMWRAWIKKYLSYLDENDNFWFDEYNTSGFLRFKGNYHEPYHGTEIATARIAFMNSGIQSSLMWTLFDQQWPNNHTNQDWHRFIDGDHRFGIMPTLFRSKVPYPSYYAVQLTGYVGGGEGTKVFSGTGEDEVNATLTVTPDGTFTVLAVNDNDTQNDVKITFEKPVGKTLYRYLYNPETITPDENTTPIAFDKTFENVTTEITDSLPAGAVVVYTDKIR